MLRILLLEDSKIDAEIIQRLLTREIVDCEFRLVMNKTDFLRSLDEYHPDVILSDHSLPVFNSMDALTAARQKLPNVPFIMVTGAVSEEFAVTIIKRGQMITFSKTGWPGYRQQSKRLWNNEEQRKKYQIINMHWINQPLWQSRIRKE